MSYRLTLMSLFFNWIWALGIALSIAFAGSWPSVATANDELQDQVAAPPALQLTAYADEASIHPGQELTVSVVLTNKSATVLNRLVLSLVPGQFALDNEQGTGTQAPPGNSLPAYGAMESQLRVRSSEEISIATHTLVILATFEWKSGNQTIHGVEAVPVEITVKREFQDELGGFLGGAGAATLYFLLPIYPAFLAYQLIDGLRKSEGFRIPSFRLEDSVPAALAAIAVSLFIQLFYGENATNGIFTTAGFLGLFAFSSLLGAIIPAVKWLRTWQFERKWNYHDVIIIDGHDKTAYLEYLRMSLLRPGARRRYPWVKVSRFGITREGLLLDYSPGRLVLGARLGVTPSDDSELPELKKSCLISDIAKAGRTIIQLIQRGQAYVQLEAGISSDGTHSIDTDFLVIVLEGAALGERDIEEEDSYPVVEVVE